MTDYNTNYEFDVSDLPDELRRLIPIKRESSNFAPINREADKALHAVFSLEPKFNLAKSREAGRPIFDQVTYCTIYMPGGKATVKHELSDEKKRRYYQDRFPAQWANFEKKNLTAFSGTPIDELPFMSVARKTEYKVQKIFTVEQLANMSDAQVDNMGMGARKEREQAEIWLGRADANASASKALNKQQELEKKIEELQKKLEAKEMKEEVEAAEKKPAKKKKTTAKKKVAASVPADAEPMADEAVDEDDKEMIDQLFS